MRLFLPLCAGLAMAAGVAVTAGPGHAQEAAEEPPVVPAADDATAAAASAAVEATAAATPALSAAERELFALNLYHEARSEGRDGMIGVAWVVLNRIESDVFPDNITAVINEPTRRGCQWGWTCDGRPDTPTEMDKWDLSLEVTDLMFGEARPADPTGGAVSFHETFRRTPGWLQRGATRTLTLKNHHFYRLN